MAGKQPPEWMGKNRKLAQAEIEEFLAGPVVARIATIDENGMPYVTPVWQEWDGEAFWIVPRERSAWVAHIKKNPNVAISCAHDGGTYTRITAQGRLRSCSARLRCRVSAGTSPTAWRCVSSASAGRNICCRPTTGRAT
jgi:nitroimidazol reductase NimA-like FMN-containing flavoprotein (pyridoxamine 5'-phosphate oxidase superfamily)